MAPPLERRGVGSPSWRWVTITERAARVRGQADEVGPLEQRIDLFGLDVQRGSPSLFRGAEQGRRDAVQLHHRGRVVLEPLPPRQGARTVGERERPIPVEVGDEPPRTNPIAASAGRDANPAKTAVPPRRSAPVPGRA